MAGETDKLTIEIGANVQGAVSGLGKVRMALDATFSGVGSILSAWAKIDKAVYLGLSGMNAAVTKFTRSVLAVGGGFEAQMNSVAVITQATGSELDALTAKAREMGETLPITAADAASAMTIMAQRGTSVNDILSSVVDVSNLAISQGVSMAEAAELLGSTLTNFKMGVDEASRVTDMFNNASNQSALNMSKLSEAMKFVGPVASSMGMSLEEALAAMEVLANAGLPGEMIGTGLRGVLQKLASSTEILGVKTRDAAGDMRSLADIMSDLSAAGMGVPDATKIFGARGATAAMSLANMSGEIDGNKERLQQWGRTADAVSEKLGTWRNIVAAFQSAQEGVRLEIFDQIKDGAKDGLSVLTEMTRSLREWIGETQVAQGAMQSFMKGLGLDIDVSGGFRAFLEGIDTSKIASAAEALGGAFRKLGGAFSTLAGLVGPLVSLIGRHMDTFVKFAFWDFVLGKASGVVKGLWDVGNGLSGFVKKAAPLAKIGLAKIAGEIGKIVASVKGVGVLNTVAVGIGALGDAFAAFIAGPAGALAGVAVALGAFAYAAWDCVKAAKELHAAKLREIDVGLTEQDAKEYAERIKHIKTGFENIEAIADDFNSKAAKEQFIARGEAIKHDNIEKLKAAMEAYNATLSEDQKGFAADEEEVMSFAEAIIKAAQGSKAALGEIPPKMQEVSFALRDIFKESERAREGLEDACDVDVKFKTEPKFAETFAASLDAGISEIVGRLPEKVEKAMEVLGSSGAELAVSANVDAARKEIEELIKSTAQAEGMSLPEEVVSRAALERLKEMGRAGDGFAKRLAEGWDGAKDELGDFLDRAKDAIGYLGASPSQFMPALSKMAGAIQKVDPVTGKLTEAFKRAHDALKEWAGVTFDALKGKISDLRKAIEGGFLKKSDLEGEFEAFSKAAKVKVAAEMEPQRGLYKDDRQFYGVAASKWVDQIREAFGDSFADRAVGELRDAAKWAGGDMGEAFRQRMKIEQDKERYAPRQQGLTSDLGRSSLSPREGGSDGIVQTLLRGLEPVAASLRTAGDAQARAGQSMATEASAFTAAAGRVAERMSQMEVALAENTAALRDVKAAIGTEGGGGAPQPGGASDGTAQIVAAITANGAALGEVKAAIGALSQGGGDVTVNLQDFTVRQESDIERIKRMIADALRIYSPRLGMGNAAG